MLPPPSTCGVVCNLHVSLDEAATWKKNECVCRVCTMNQVEALGGEESSPRHRNNIYYEGMAYEESRKCGKKRKRRKYTCFEIQSGSFLYRCRSFKFHLVFRIYLLSSAPSNIHMRACMHTISRKYRRIGAIEFEPEKKTVKFQFFAILTHQVVGGLAKIRNIRQMCWIRRNPALSFSSVSLSLSVYRVPDLFSCARAKTHSHTAAKPLDICGAHAWYVQHQKTVITII